MLTHVWCGQEAAEFLDYSLWDPGFTEGVVVRVQLGELCSTYSYSDMCRVHLVNLTSTRRSCKECTVKPKGVIWGSRDDNKKSESQLTSAGT